MKKQILFTSMGGFFYELANACYIYFLIYNFCESY